MIDTANASGSGPGTASHGGPGRQSQLRLDPIESGLGLPHSYSSSRVALLEHYSAKFADSSSDDSESDSTFNKVHWRQVLSRTLTSTAQTSDLKVLQ